MADPENQPTRFSKPAAMQTSLFLRLPAELRNKIYQFCFNDDDGKACVLYHKNRPLPVSLLRACQGMHHEAASTLYSNNIFGFLQEHHGDDLPETSTIFEPCNSIAFLNTIGLNSVLVSNIILDMTFRTCNGPPNLSEEQKSSSLIEVTEYLRPIWQSNLTENLQVTFENHDGFIQDLDAFNKAFRFLQLGSTKVKKYHQLVDRAYIKGDGSGGTISWGPLPTGEDQ